MKSERGSASSAAGSAASAISRSALPGARCARSALSHLAISTGMPSAQRNAFPPELKDKIQFLLDRFNQGEKVKKLDEIVTVDERVQGCPMIEAAFLAVIDKMLKEFGIVTGELGMKNEE